MESIQNYDWILEIKQTLNKQTHIQKFSLLLYAKLLKHYDWPNYHKFTVDFDLKAIENMKLIKFLFNNSFDSFVVEEWETRFKIKKI